MEKKWVLQLCHGYSPPFDDVARQWRALFEGSDSRVLTVFLTGEPDERVKQLVGGDVVFLGFKSKDLRGLKLRQIRAVKALHQKYQFCLAVAHRYKSIYIATHVQGFKVIGVSHAYGVYDRFWRKRYIKRQAQLLLAGVSDAIRDDARRALPAFAPERIQTVYNHIDVEKMQADILSREEARKQLGLAQTDFVVGNVGRLHPDKDQATLIEAFAKGLKDMPGSRLVIVGDGRLRPNLQKQIAELEIDDRVELTGRIPEAFRYFRAFDVFALSSDYEPFGMVLLEAMAAPIPVISSDCGGAPEVLGEAGRFFPVANVGALAEQLVNTYQDSKEHREVVAKELNNRLRNMFSDEAVCQSFSTLRAMWDCG